MLLTPRLKLRPPCDADTTAVFHCYAADPEVTHYVGWPRHRDIEDTRSFITDAVEQWRRWPAGPLLVESREDGRLLGATGLAFESADAASTGYVLAKAAWGRGYAQEILTAVVGLADSLAVPYVYALCHADHAVSVRVLERCGFGLEEVIKDSLPFPNLVDGGLHDVLRYSRARGATQTERIARGLVARTLPKSEWTHHAHLCAGLWHVLRYPDAQALDLLRDRIRAYNEATGGVNTESSGYHETITRFYVHVIRQFVARADSRRPADELAQELIARHGEHELPLRYYSRERLFSVEARLGWVEPDLRPLDPAA